MKVVVRVRPFNEKEANSRTVVQVLDQQWLLFDPKEQEDEFFYQGTKQNFRDIRKKANKELRFNFNNVFDETSENEEIYKCTTAEIVEDLMNGYNCSVFAYGPTGAGKTFTMLGNDEIPGITYMTMVGLYNRIETMTDKTFEIAATYIEVYNENLRDLLCSSNNLQIREDPRRGVLVAGISVHKPKNAQELLNMLRSGNLNRSQHSTDANAESSRSHAVFTVFVNRIDRSGKLNGDTRGKMSFIDLAGSERATAISKNKVPRLREGANINKSLLALGNCINALADNKGKNHVPYRDSKLTRLLKDSLGGNCKTIMIVAVSPSHLSYEDTYNTLKYADRAQCIKVDAKQNIRATDKSYSELIKLVSQLRQEIERLKSQLALQVIPTEPCTAPKVTSPATVQAEAEKIYEENTEFREAFSKICTEELKLLPYFYHLKKQLRDFEFHIYRKERRCTLLKCVALGTQPVPDSTIANLHHRFKAMKDRKETTANQINELQNRKKVIIDGHNLMEEDKIWIDLKNQEIKIENLKLENQNFARTVKEIDNNNCINNKLLDAMLPLFRRQYTLLMGYGNGSNDVVEDYEKVANMVRDYKDVSWADQSSNPEESDPCDITSASNLKLMSLEGIDLTLSSISSAETVLDKPLKCPRSLVYPSESGNEMPKSPISESVDDDFNSTFTKEGDSPKSVHPPVISIKPIIAAKVKSPTFKNSLLKNQRSISSSMLKRPLSTSTNTLSRSESTSDLNIKKRKFSPFKSSSPFGTLKMNLLKMRSQRRNHPYRVDTANRASIKSKETSAMDQVNALIPKQTITSMMRTNKLPTNNPPRLQ